MAAAAALALLAATAVYTNTASVEDVEEHGGLIWAATRGGLEGYDARTLERVAHFPALHAYKLERVGDELHAVTRAQRCVIEAAGPRDCREAPPPPPRNPEVAPSYQGARETVRVTTTAGVIVGTAGGGLWLHADAPAAPRRLTPGGQICDNHVNALASWRGETWVGTFDGGLCVLRGGEFVTVQAPFRMVNDLAVTRKGLAIAAGEGLFVSKDGVRFTRWKDVADGGFNDLAVDGDVLYATTAGALWRLPLTKKAGRPKITWLPGGARSLQAVAAAKGQVWLVSEDHGALEVGEAVVVHDRAAGLPTSWALDVTLSGGRVFAATLRHGLLVRDAGGGGGGDWRVVDGIEPWLLHVSPDGAGGVWAGAQGGLFHVTRAGEVTAHHDLVHENVHVVLAAPGGVWVGTEGGLMHTRLDAAP